MNLSGLLPLLARTSEFQDFAEELSCSSGLGRDSKPLGLPPVARPYFAAALYQSVQRPVVFVAARPDRARELTERLAEWLGQDAPLYLFAAPDTLPYERIPWSAETVRERLAALAALSARHHPTAPRENADAPRPFIVTSARALLSKTLPPREFRAADRLLYRGQKVTLSTLTQALTAAGYEPAAVVEAPATFSVRGGILDVFSSHAPYPVRVELWGDEISSLRLFDPTTQRSMHQVEQYRAAPASETLPGPARIAVERLRQWDFANCHAAAEEQIRDELERLEVGARFRGVEFYAPFVYSAPASLLQYLPEDAVLMAEDWREVESDALSFCEQAEALRMELEIGGDIPKGIGSPAFDWSEVEEQGRAFARVQLGWPSDDEEADAVGELFAPAPHFGGQLRVALDYVGEVVREQLPVVVVSRQVHRLASLLNERHVNASVVDEVPPELPQAQALLAHGSIDGGWELRGERDGVPSLLLLTDRELFGWAKPEPRRPRRTRPLAPEAFFADVSPGDHVVHVEQGIGVFRGLVRLDVDGTDREYLRVDYQGTDKLYVPIDQADRLSRYVGATDRPPKLSRLGTADWALVKARARRAVESIAQELLELYSAREVIPGYSFSSDSEWQQDLESAFPYIETEDQADAISAVKSDMERPHPMDRLICGDVGYGKTEVALRAAFKAVMDSKQVAVLVPTTVLAQQHFETFRERLKPFPVEVEMLSRFRSKGEQRDVVRKVATGQVDIVVGTHRLLQKDVQFKDLGLLVIDEEQRFGVTHKEWLKQKRREVDVLTLTATPIPRTLYMSLAGARDMSTIDTPPEERLPIKTYVGEYDEHLIRRAILRELNRGGQVYFVHNRVQGIRQMAQRIAKLVPDANIGIAHGQMPEAELEKVMLDFADGYLDILVCTSIIESGLDIPSANTIIINRADRFGLAQLYQLRGRVGRSTQRAYAYLLYPRHQPMSVVARKRLDTIMQASELGAGFRIAMRDLEIRGAGELLGARQHGHISAVGFDLYCRLLAQAVEEVKGESAPGLLDEKALYLRPLHAGTQFNLPMEASLPESYIRDSDVRLQVYRRLASAGSVEDVAQVEREMEDRFGPVPEEAQNLLFLMRIKAVATQCDVQTVGQEAGQIVVRAPWLYGVDKAAFQGSLPGGARLGRGQVWIALDDEWRHTLEQTIRTMHEQYQLLEAEA